MCGRSARFPGGGLLSAGSHRAVLLRRTRLRLARYIPNFPDGKLRDLLSHKIEGRPWCVGGVIGSRAGGLLSAGSRRAVLLHRTRLRLAKYVPNFPDGKLRDLLSHKTEGRHWCVGGAKDSRAGGLLSAGSRRAVLLRRTRLRLAKYVPNFPDGKLRD